MPYKIGSRVRLTRPVWHGFTRAAGSTGTIVPDVSTNHPEGERTYWVALDNTQEYPYINVWESEIEVTHAHPGE